MSLKRPRRPKVLLADLALADKIEAHEEYRGIERLTGSEGVSKTALNTILGEPYNPWRILHLAASPCWKTGRLFVGLQ